MKVNCNQDNECLVTESFYSLLNGLRSEPGLFPCGPQSIRSRPIRILKKREFIVFQIFLNRTQKIFQCMELSKLTCNKLIDIRVINPLKK